MLFIKELAMFEKALHKVTNTEENLLKDCFGKNAICGFYVAQLNKEIVGIALYYTRYSTWQGRVLYLEDIIVKEEFRSKKIGSKLFDTLSQYAKKKGFKTMQWQVLDWNKDAISFYKKYNTQFDNEWLNVSMIL
jgi:ribosomal protein S18 acetylase RimI-like enzyme